MNPPLTPSQRRLAVILSVVLVAGGTFVLVFLARIPLPARLVMAVADYGVAAALLLYLRQNR